MPESLVTIPESSNPRPRNRPVTIAGISGHDHRNTHPLALATWQTGLAVLTLAVLTPFDGMGAILTDTRALLGASVGLGVLGTGGAFLAYYFIIEKLGPLRASGATYIAPVVAVLIGVAAGEQVTALEWGALGLILGGVVLIQTRRR